MVHVANSAAVSKSGLLRLAARALLGSPASAAALSGATAVRARRLPAALGAQPGRLLAASRRAAALHGAAVCCSASASEVVEVQLKVEGMVCDGCSSRVEEALSKMPGVTKVHVDLEKGLATVHVEAASQIDAFNAMPAMVDVVSGLGFGAEPHFGEA